MAVDQNSFIRQRPFFAKKKILFRESFANSMLLFRRTHVEQQLLLWRLIQHLPNHTKLSRITSSWPCKHAASITESPSQDKLLLIRHFYCKACWATPFKMRFDCRPVLRRTFAELSRKIPLFADPSQQQRAHQRNSKHQGPWCLGLAKPHFWKLGCCIWSLFLETSESTVRQYERQVFSCGEASPSEAWLLPMKGKVNVVCHSPAGPRAPGRPLTSCNVYNDNDS